MNKLEMIKAATQLVVSVGVGMITSNLINASTPSNIKPIKKVFIAIGGMVLADMASTYATKHTEYMIDDYAKTFKNMMKQS